MTYSLIIPVYNRPDEIDELLESLTKQSLKDFEVIIVEDGSAITCEHVCDNYKDKLNLHYYCKENAGPSVARNYGAQRASGEWLIILDSDVVLPSDYISEVDKEIREKPCDAFGGADAAHPDFTPTQKAISYSMTSFFTTGGIRGGKKKLDRFFPRSYNMGVKTDVYNHLGGFDYTMRFGEDIDFSIRIFNNGYKCRLFPKAWVWHKRRTDFRKFFRQVYNSGIARINLYKKYPKSLKTVHLLPTLFILGVAGLLILAIMGYTMALTPLALYCLLIFTDAGLLQKNIKVGLLSIISSFVQLTGYGSGFMVAFYKRCILREKDFRAFEKTFYK